MTDTGMLAKSKAGHDKGQIFLIVDCDEEYVFLADGRLRPICRPKKKKRRHVQLIKRLHVDITDDAAIRKLLREYNRSTVEHSSPRQEGPA